jgi:mxaJ protein
VKRAAALLFALIAGAAQAQAQPAAFRVCADPDNLPYSRSDRSGFENRIAQLVAAELGLPLEYAWLPDRRGFVRKTLGAGLCDVIVGVPADFDRTLNTKPYYRSSYVLLEPTAPRHAIAGFDDPLLRELRVGVQLIGDDMAATPPGYALTHVGAVQNVRGFPLPGEQPSAARIVAALANGSLDVAFVWGPQAAYFARQSVLPLRWRMLPPPAGLKGQSFEFAIAMGVRRGNAALRDRLDAVLVRRRDDIAQILAEYGVPLVDKGTP